MSPSLPIAKYHVVELTLATRIRDGVYASGTLPGERELAAEFQVARVTIRHALMRLEEQGLVARHERRGTLVLSGRGGPPRRQLLRALMDQFLDRGRRDQRKVLSFGRVVATQAVAQALGLATGQAVLRVVRLRSHSGQSLTYTEAFVPAALAHVLDRQALARKAFIQMLEEGGVKIGAAEQVLRAERAPPEVAAALGLHVHEPVLKFERIVRDEAGAAVQLLLGWYRAECFEVRMQMSRADDLTRAWIGQR